MSFISSENDKAFNNIMFMEWIFIHINHDRGKRSIAHHYFVILYLKEGAFLFDPPVLSRVIFFLLLKKLDLLMKMFDQQRHALLLVECVHHYVNQLNLIRHLRYQVNTLRVA